MDFLSKKIHKKFAGIKNSCIFDSSNNNKEMKHKERFNEVTEQLNKMFKGTEEKKELLVKGLKKWCATNSNTEDRGKLDAIKCFLADNGIF